MKNSVGYLLKSKQLQKYKDKINLEFFEGLEKKITWINDFKESRDRLIHHYSHLVFSTTRKGELGYDVVDAYETWGRDTVIGISEGLQNIIDSLSDLMEYLSRNLPRTS